MVVNVTGPVVCSDMEEWIQSWLDPERELSLCWVGAELNLSIRINVSSLLF